MTVRLNACILLSTDQHGYQTTKNETSPWADWGFLAAQTGAILMRCDLRTAFVLKVTLMVIVSVEAEAQVRAASHLEKEFGGNWIGAVCSTPQPAFLKIRVSHVHSNVATFEEHGISGFDGIQLHGFIGELGKLILEIPSGSDLLSIHLGRVGLTLVGTSVTKDGASDAATKVVLVYDQRDTSLEEFKRQVPTVCDLYPEGLDRYAQAHSNELLRQN